MKKHYQKPTLSVERYALTQSLAACSGIKITNFPNKTVAQDVMADADAPSILKSLARRGYFLAGAADGCVLAMDGQEVDGICFHTSVNAAFYS